MRALFMIPVVALLLFTGCGYDDFGLYEPTPSQPVEYNLDIATLRAYYAGSPLCVTQDMVIRGSVTTSDKENNFFRTFVIEDATGAIEVRAGLYDMHNIYPVGQRVAVKLKGLVVAMDQGVLQVGAAPLPSSPYATDYLGQRPAVDTYVIREGICTPVNTLQATIPALLSEYCGRLVTIPSLRFAETGPGTWGNPSSNPDIPPTTGYRKFKSPTGDSLIVVVSGYAEFAADAVPQNVPCAITGILLYGPALGTGGRSVYMLKPRDLGDVK